MMNETKGSTQDNSDAHLELLNAMAADLVQRLEKMRTNIPKGIPGYKFAMCVFIAHAAKGFLSLQNDGNKQASRTLVRPCIEATFKLCAVHNAPHSLLSIAYSEHLEDGKLLKAAKDNQIICSPEQHHAKWINELRPKIMKAMFPGQSLAEKSLSAFDLSKIAKKPELYNFQFRLYCNATHASLRGVMFPDLYIPAVDYSSIGECLISALAVMDSLGSKVPALQEYLDQTKLLMKAATDTEEKEP